MMRNFLAFYFIQKFTRTTVGGIYGLTLGIKNKKSTDMNIAYEESRKKYQNGKGKTITDEVFKKIVRNKVDEHQESLISLASERIEPKNSTKLIPHLEKTKKVCQAAFTDLGLKESNLIVSFYEGSHLSASVNSELKFIGDIPVYSVNFDIQKGQEFTEKFYKEVYAVAGHEAIHTTQLVAQDTISLIRYMSFFFAFPLISLSKEASDEWNYGYSYATPSLISKIFEIDADLRSSIHLKTAGDLKKHLEEKIPPHERNKTSQTHPSPATRIKYLNIISKFQGENSSLFFKAYQKINAPQKMNTCQNQMESLDRQSEQRWRQKRI